MKNKLLLIIFCLLSTLTYAQKMITMSKEKLKDKIMGGWAGQTICCTPILGQCL